MRYKVLKDYVGRNGALHLAGSIVEIWSGSYQLDSLLDNGFIEELGDRPKPPQEEEPILTINIRLCYNDNVK